MFELNFSEGHLIQNVLIITGRLAILCLPLVAAFIIRHLSPTFFGRKCSFDYALNAGIYGFVGLIMPMLCIGAARLYLSDEDIIPVVHFLSASALCLNLLTMFLAVMFFHKIPWRRAAALTAVVYFGAWVFLLVFTAVPQAILIVMGVIPVV